MDWYVAVGGCIEMLALFFHFGKDHSKVSDSWEELILVSDQEMGHDSWNGPETVAIFKRTWSLFWCLWQVMLCRQLEDCDSIIQAGEQSVWQKFTSCLQTPCVCGRDWVSAARQILRVNHIDERQVTDDIKRCLLKGLHTKGQVLTFAGYGNEGKSFLLRPLAEIYRASQHEFSECVSSRRSVKGFHFGEHLGRGSVLKAFFCFVTSTYSVTCGSMTGLLRRPRSAGIQRTGERLLPLVGAAILWSCRPWRFSAKPGHIGHPDLVVLAGRNDDNSCTAFEHTWEPPAIQTAATALHDMQFCGVTHSPWETDWNWAEHAPQPAPDIFVSTTDWGDPINTMLCELFRNVDPIRRQECESLPCSRLSSRQRHWARKCSREWSLKATGVLRSPMSVVK